MPLSRPLISPPSQGEVEMCSFVLLPRFLSCWVEATAAFFLCQFFLVLKDSPACRTVAVWASLWGEPQLSGTLGDSWTLRLSACPSSPSINSSHSINVHTEPHRTGKLRLEGEPWPAPCKAWAADQPRTLCSWSLTSAGSENEGVLKC